MGTGSKYFVMLAILAAAGSAATAAMADDWPDHDRRIEKWVAEQISGKLGELRGSFDHQEDIDAVIVHTVPKTPKPRPKPASRIFILPKATRTLPPIVGNDILPPGVDPIITGSNAHPTGNARRRGDAMRYAERLPLADRILPQRTSMLID